MIQRCHSSGVVATEQQQASAQQTTAGGRRGSLLDALGKFSSLGCGLCLLLALHLLSTGSLGLLRLCLERLEAQRDAHPAAREVQEGSQGREAVRGGAAEGRCQRDWRAAVSPPARPGPQHSLVGLLYGHGHLSTRSRLATAIPALATPTHGAAAVPSRCAGTMQVLLCLAEGAKEAVPEERVAIGTAEGLLVAGKQQGTLIKVADNRRALPRTPELETPLGHFLQAAAA